MRGAPAVYDGWAKAGNAGWSFDEVLPFFRKLETDLDFADAWHGPTGPLPIRRHAPGELNAVQAAFLDAARGVGLPSVADHNRPGAVGVGLMPRDTRDGVRMSTALSYSPTPATQPHDTGRGDGRPHPDLGRGRVRGAARRRRGRARRSGRARRRRLRQSGDSPTLGRSSTRRAADRSRRRGGGRPARCRGEPDRPLPRGGRPAGAGRNVRAPLPDDGHRMLPGGACGANPTCTFSRQARSTSPPRSARPAGSSA